MEQEFEIAFINGSTNADKFYNTKAHLLRSAIPFLQKRAFPATSMEQKIKNVISTPPTQIQFFLPNPL